MRSRGREPQATARTQLPEGLPSSHHEWLAEVPRDRMPFPAIAPIYVEAQTQAAAPLDTHIHDALEVGVVLAGEQRRFSEGFTFRSLLGDVWLIPMWEPHGWEVVREKTRIVMMNFLPDLLGNEVIGDASWLRGFAVAPHLRPRVSSPQMRRQVMAIARELWTEIQDQEYAWVTAVRAGLLRLLTILYRSWHGPENAGAAPQLHANSLQRVMPAVAALQQQSGRRITVSEAAGLCGLGRRQFHRIFSQTMGVGFQTFALRARLGHVQRLLTATDLPVETVARESGFFDLPHLHRHFVRHYGCTPGAFRSRTRDR